MATNPFALTPSEYKRDIDVLKHYVSDSALYLHQMTGRPLVECVEFVKTSVRPGGEFAFVDPEVRFLERGDNGDRVEKLGKLSTYIGDAIRSKELIVPTFTTYLPPSVKKSLLVDFIDGNVKARGVAKKAKFAAEVAGDTVLYVVKDIEQTNKKLSNNSLSGAHVSASTPLYNKTAHSTLTSNCRTTSGYGNANNEKFLCGNRHYWSPDIVRNNIISIINHSDYVMLASALLKYGIRHPTVGETLACIRYSTDLYWNGHIEHAKLAMLVQSLSDIQRSAFVYTGDLYHLMLLNGPIVRQFITRLSLRIDVQHKDPKIVIDNAPEDNRNLASQICETELKGTSVRKLIGTPAYGIYASTVENISRVLEEYRLLIRAFWVTVNVPASLAVLPDSIRRCAVTSDTDSTIFTVQDWVIWHQGKLGFTSVHNAVAATMIFLASQTITHVLARMSANFGIEEKRIHQIAMKNEFFFPIFTPTGVAKHYFALIGCQEGNIFSQYKKEIKGVHLKSSNASKLAMSEASKMMEFIMMSVIEGKLISLDYILKWIGDLERDVVASIQKGSFEYFRKGQVKSADSYTKDPEDSPYAQYLFWNEVFGPKYGESQPPPYSSIKVSTQLNKPGTTKEWIAAIEDRELAERISGYLVRNNRKHLGSTFMLPEQIIVSKGIPKEILDAVGVRRIVLDTTAVFYIILEAIGLYMLNDKSTRLIMDHY